MRTMTYRKRYDAVADEKARKETAIDFTDDPGKTLQEPTEDTDINVLMKRMGVKDGSELPRFSSPYALYGDFSEIPNDPTIAAEILREGQLAFLRLPAELRNRYRTPEALFEFMNDNENYDEAVKLGLLERKKEPLKQAERAPGDTSVSPSTSSVKEQLVQTSQTSPKEK